MRLDTTREIAMRLDLFLTTIRKHLMFAVAIMTDPSLLNIPT